MSTENNYRYIARITLEAETPLFVGSGESSLLRDSLVTKDVNGWPMIPGTSLTGVLRHTYESLEKDSKELFGFQDNNKGEGSRLILSNARMFISKNEVSEGIMNKDYSNTLSKFENLPNRQHVRINAKGVAETGGLFDNEVVYKGSRFLFEMELIGTKEDESVWNELLQIIDSSLFRVGAGTRNGYGNVKACKIDDYRFDFSEESAIEEYLNFPVSLNVKPSKKTEGNVINNNVSKNTRSYTLDLKPDDFFIFSEGYGDDEVDNKPIEEEVLVYTEDGIDFISHTLIPGSSIKGAIAHRTAFHFNKLIERYADKLIPAFGEKIALEIASGSGNKAVNTLFGLGSGFEFEKETKEVLDDERAMHTEIGDSRRGNVIIDDIFLSKERVSNDKIFNHVAIDRFTGGGIDAALFNEKVSYLKDENDSIQLKITLGENIEDQTVLFAFENALLDITKGLLPLGGMTTKGNGMFTGTLKVSFDGEEKEIIDYHNKQDLK